MVVDAALVPRNTKESMQWKTKHVHREVPWLIAKCCTQHVRALSRPSRWRHGAIFGWANACTTPRGGRARIGTVRCSAQQLVIEVAGPSRGRRLHQPSVFHRLMRPVLVHTTSATQPSASAAIIIVT